MRLKNFLDLFKTRLLLAGHVSTGLNKSWHSAWFLGLAEIKSAFVYTFWLLCSLTKTFKGQGLVSVPLPRLLGQGVSVSSQKVLPHLVSDTWITKCQCLVTTNREIESDVDLDGAVEHRARGHKVSIVTDGQSAQCSRLKKIQVWLH